MPVTADPAPGDLLRTALDLFHRAKAVVRRAVIAEREGGTTWDQIGEATSTTRRSAHERWREDVQDWAANGRTALRGGTRRTLDYAAEVDGLHARLRPNQPPAVTSGLDATRFPGSQAYENALRAPGTALQARCNTLNKRAERLYAEYERLHAEEDEDNDFVIAPTTAPSQRRSVMR
ncbi:hypothetical protein [Streptomyces sp. NPDC048473]|uniref:hypothetical protein n=1 Tax=unclassified Streptomyces TaxID=2593676 RepID=UPI003714EEF1